MRKTMMWGGFSMAAVFSVLAIFMVITRGQGWEAFIPLLVAGIGLGVGFVGRGVAVQERPVEIDVERAEVIIQKRKQGDMASAVSQLRMWYPQLTPEEAGNIVRSLKREGDDGIKWQA